MAEKAFSQFGDVALVPARRINRKMLLEADVLLVRSVTRVDADLLAGTPVGFVGTATAGVDHIDLDSLANMNIEVASAPGSNASSVCDYVVASILRLATRHNRRLERLTCVVVGCGAVGGRLAARLEHLGLTVLRCDPPLDAVLNARGQSSPFVDLTQALPHADIITLHVPLHGDPHSTYDLMDAKKLNAAKEAAWIINTSRGAVVNEEDLLAWLRMNDRARCVIDVWSNEPNLSCRLVERASIATAHIAGYASEGKRRATFMLRDALADWAGQNVPDSQGLTEPIDLVFDRNVTSTELWLNDLVSTVYDIESDDRILRPICDLPPRRRADHFENIRRDYPIRHEFARYRIPRSSVPEELHAVLTGGLSMQIA